MVSGTITDLSGRTLTGQQWRRSEFGVAFSVAVDRVELRAGAERDAALHRGALEQGAVFVSTYPNAGLPDPLSETGFPETPESLAPQLLDWASQGG